MLGSVLPKESNKYSSNESSSHTTKRLNNDILNSHVDDARSPKTSPKSNTYLNGGYDRSPITHSISQVDILGEDHGISHQFGVTQKSIVNNSKANDSFVSIRNMKPPLRPREGSYSVSLNFGGTSTGGVIPEEDYTLTNSSHENNSYNRPSSLRKRSSIDSKSEITDDVPPLGSRFPHNATTSSFQIDTVR
jgi:hypothetical protein